MTTPEDVTIAISIQQRRPDGTPISHVTGETIIPQRIPMPSLIALMARVMALESPTPAPPHEGEQP